MALLRQSLCVTNCVLARTVQHFLRKDTRQIKRWVAPTLKQLAARRKKVGPDPESPRSSYLEWNYDVELCCFAKRVGEEFDNSLLKQAFVQREWANMQEFKSKESGDCSFEPLQHNYELSQNGLKLISKIIKEAYSKSYPTDIVKAVCDHLTTDEMLAHIAKHLGMRDLVKSQEYPPETKTLADAFKAIVSALSVSSDFQRVQQFVNDFVIVQMNGKDIYDIWTPEKPYEYLIKLLQEKGVSEVELRLCNQSAINTILANYQVGLYNAKDKSCLGLGWGENVKIAKDTAALNALQRIYSYVNK
ncbi:large ribosomal subunit protein mL44 [Euwallacea fornicatus]|uniref:large ribosomal subunit protein mL44 n=1 Tax=Euwallacea fornicatus TaxID=995702 RepID=UPI00338EAA69